MYQLPTTFDFQRNLDTLIHKGEHQARAAAAHVKSDHAARGLADSTTIITMAIGKVDEIHQDIIRESMQLIADFSSQNTELTPGLLAGTARNRLDNFGTFLLTSVPRTSFTQEAQRFRTQYTHVFRQRLDGALRDIQIGFIGGRKIVSASAVPAPATEPTTSTLSDAITLKPGLWGMSIDLLKAFKWLREGLHSFGRKQQQATPQSPNKRTSISSRLWRDPVWSKVIATGITAGIGALVVWYFHAQNPPPPTTPTPAILAPSPAMTQQAPQPSPTANRQGPTAAPSGRSSTSEDQTPISWQPDFEMNWYSGPRMAWIRFVGQSTTFAHIKDAYIVSKLTGHREPLEVANATNFNERWNVNQIEPIPPGAITMLVYEPKPPPSVPDFLNQWGAFEFHVVYDGGEYTKIYSQDYVHDKFASELPGIYGSHVTPLKGPK